MNFTCVSLLTLDILNRFINLIFYVEVCIYIISFMCFGLYKRTILHTFLVYNIPSNGELP